MPFGGEKSGAKFGPKFLAKFSGLFCCDIQGNKNFSKNFSPEFPWPCTAKLWDRKSLSIAKNHLKTSQEISEQFGPSTHKIKGLSKNSHQKVHPNFAKILGRQILGNTLSAPKKTGENSGENFMARFCRGPPTNSSSRC